MNEAMRGQCLCGAVTVVISEQVRDVGACHCSMCRTWCSGPWLAVTAPPETRIEGGELKVYRSSWATERGFCGVCGSHIFHGPQDGPEMAVSAGLFDDRGFSITREICHDAKPPFYRFEAVSARHSGARLAVSWLPRLIIRRLGRWLGQGAA